MGEADPKEWSTFIKHLQTLLSTYEFQEDLSKYNVRNLDDWGKTGKEQGIVVSHRNMPKFFSIIQNYNIDVSHVNKTETFDNWSKGRQLNNIIQYTLKHWPQLYNCETDGRTIRVKGEYIKMKDIDLEECNKRNKSTVKVKTLEIIASDTIFIDADFTSTDPEFSLMIVAPKWSVIGTRSIKLDGEDAQPLDSQKAGTGLDGQPGLPGKPGGNFLGIAQTIINGKNLTITSNGGQGGRGQDGGDGLTGEKGRDATTANFDNLEHEKIGGTRWRIYGGLGKEGGTGGNGGKGGIGGSPGQLHFLNSGETGVKIEARQGDQGDAGIGGQRGLGGKFGNNLEAAYIICCWSDEEEVKNEKRGLNGEQGIDGVNEAGRVKPDDAKETNFRNSISEIKVTFREYLKKNSYTGGVQKFLSHMDLSPEIVTYLKLEGIVNDYEKLEAQFRQSYDTHILLFPFYENLKKVVEQQVPENEDEKILLFHLYTTLLSKLDIIDEKRVDGYLVVKIEDYLNTQTDKYRRWQRYGGDDVFQEYYTIRKDGIDDHIKETKDFIKEYVIDDIKQKLTENHDENQFENTMKNTRNHILKMVAEVLQNFENMGLEFNKIISETNHISKLLDLKNSTDVKVPKAEISIIRTTLNGTQITQPTIDADKFKDVEGAEAQLNELKIYGKSVEDLIRGMLQQITKDIDHFEAELKAKSLSSLDVTKWQIPTVLKRIKYFVKQLPKDEASNTLEGLNHLIDIYKRIENFYRLKKIGDYVKLLDSTEWASKLKNDSFSERLTKLKRHTVANLLISQYENNVDIIKQYAFPYVDELFKKYKLRDGIISQSDNFTALLYENIDNTKSLQYSLFHSLSDSFVDKWIMSGYDYDYPVSVWSHKPLLKKFFSGQNILLRADSLYKHVNAVQFNWVEIHFKAINETNQKIVDDAMEDFAVDLTHFGNSYYNCDNKTYLVTTAPIQLRYGIEKSGEVPYGRRTFNGVYERIHQGDAILSPIATWIVQLQDTDERRSAPYRKLRSFHELVDLQLIVRRTYFGDNPRVCRHNIDDFYDLDDPFPSLQSFDTLQRNRRDTKIALTSSGSSLSSPVNNMFKWISSSLGLSIGPVVYFGNFATKSLQGVSKSSFLNPVSFFDQVNSLLILAPVLVWLGRHFFKRNIDSIEENNEKIQDSRIEIWKSFLETFRKILMKYCLQVKWLWVNLEERADEMGLVRSKDEADSFETRLIILLVDFLEDIQYDPAFVRVKFDEKFLGDVNKLVEKAVDVSYFARKLNML